MTAQETDTVCEKLVACARAGDVTGLCGLLDENPWLLKRDDALAAAMDQAILHDHGPVLTQLFDRGVKVDLENDEGATPFHAAAFRRKTDILLDLLRRGANIDHQDRNGNTALHKVVNSGDCNMTEMLIDLGADAGIINKKGYSPVGIAQAKRYLGLERGLHRHLALRKERRLKRICMNRRLRP